jgi:hypothetical protein
LKKEDSEWEPVTKECHCTSYTVKNLTPNSIYSFRISAINKYGFSKSSKASDPIKLFIDSLSNENNDEQIDRGIKFDKYKYFITSINFYVFKQISKKGL